MMYRLCFTRVKSYNEYMQTGGVVDIEDHTPMLSKETLEVNLTLRDSWKDCEGLPTLYSADYSMYEEPQYIYPDQVQDIINAPRGIIENDVDELFIIHEFVALGEVNLLTKK